MKKYIEQLVEKKIAVLGYGINNQKLLEWIFAHGAKDVTICDRNKSIIDDDIVKEMVAQLGLKLNLGERYLDNLSKYDIVFRTPGIPYFNDKIQDAKKKGVIISSQTNLFFQLCPGKIIGVTGTKGKGTTSTLIYEILKKTNESRVKGVSNIYLGGNIGKDPFEFIDEIEKNDWVILELSSFQLQDLNISPHIAVVLNITSDHLDHHKTVKEYRDAKLNIVRHQNKDDFTVINMDYLTSFEFAETSPTENDYYFSVKKSVDLGTYIKRDSLSRSDQGIICMRDEKSEKDIIKTDNIKIVGRHNLENICAAVCASRLAGAKLEIISQVVGNFKGLRHRIEFIEESDGVKYYNDSASTNPDTAIAAIKSFSEPLVLILGGSSKNAKYDRLAQEILKRNIRAIISMGITGKEIVKNIKELNQSDELKIYENCKNMKEAVMLAKKTAKDKDVVLLSPASASFGMFVNYQDRGDQFREEVLNR